MSKYVDAIIGHAIGDAMGVPTEFCLREKLLENPVTKMVSSSKVGQPAGSWSDDTSMEIATIDSYINNGEFKYDDIMERWTRWLNKSEYTAAGETFDVGRTCLAAIRRYNDGIEPIKCGLDSISANGNGSLMRILPVALYSYSKKLDDENIIKLVNDISSLTHAHDISKLGCYIYVKYVIYLLEGFSKEDAYSKIRIEDYSSYTKTAIDVYERLLRDDIRDYSVNEINSSGYIVDTLECAIWILLKAKSFRETILATTNIGQDTDTIGAVAGSMAGIVYGYENIPKDWIKELQRKEYLIELANSFEKRVNGDEIERLEVEYNLDRFLMAQKDKYMLALQEIKEGHKHSHWMWYIFPQLAALGESDNSKYYGIKDLDEAKAYLENYSLSSRLIEISKVLYRIDDDISNVFDYPDDLKLKSSMTLFYCADSSIDIFKKIIDKFYNGEFDSKTIELLKK